MNFFTVTDTFKLRDGFVMVPGFPSDVVVQVGDFLCISYQGDSQYTWLAGLEMLNPSRPGPTAIFLRDPTLRSAPPSGATVHRVATATIPSATNVKALAQGFDETLEGLQHLGRQGLKVISRLQHKPIQVSAEILPPVEILAFLSFRINFYDGKATVLEFSIADVLAFVALSPELYFIRRAVDGRIVEMLISPWQRIA